MIKGGVVHLKILLILFLLSSFLLGLLSVTIDRPFLFFFFFQPFPLTDEGVLEFTATDFNLYQKCNFCTRRHSCVCLHGPALLACPQNVRKKYITMHWRVSWYWKGGGGNWMRGNLQFNSLKSIPKKATTSISTCIDICYTKGQTWPTTNLSPRTFSTRQGADRNTHANQTVKISISFSIRKYGIYPSMAYKSEICSLLYSIEIKHFHWCW